MIRDATQHDITAIDEIINEASLAYRGAIPADCWHGPYMTRDALLGEIAAGVRFCVREDDGRVVGVMGLQRVHDATLIRHAYVRAAKQGSGIGSELMDWLIARADGPL